ncbi:MAG: YfhO family protein [bacterium]|nr:YfhO family protein [bacterium]
MRLRKKDLFYLSIYLFFCGLFFKDVIFQDATFFYRDIVRYYQPMHVYASEGVWRGIMPFWNPYIFSGMPFLATLQHAIFYPLSLVHYLFPFITGFKYLFIAQYVLAGLGLYLLLRSFSLSPASSLAGIIVFTFNGYLSSILNLLTTLSAVTWLTFGLLFFMRAGNKRGWFWPVLLSFVLALEFYSGQPEVMYFNLILLIAYSLYLLCSKSARTKDILFILLVSGIAAWLLIQPLFLLLKEMLSLSVREKGVKYDLASFWSLHPLELVTTFIRSFSWDFVGLRTWFRQSWLISFYFGFLPLFFMALSYRNPGYRKLVRFFTWLGLAGLIIALGKYTPIHKFLYAFMPGFNLVRYPVKYIYILDLSMVVLAGIGLEFLLTAGEDKKNTKRLAVFSGSVLGGYALFYLCRNNIADWLVKTYMQKVAAAKIALFYQDYLPTILKDYFQGLVVLLLFGLLWLIRHKIKEPFFHLGLAVVIYGNLTFFHSVQDTEPIVREKFYTDKPPVIRFLQENLGENRYLFEKEERVYVGLDDLSRDKLPLLSNMGLNHHLADAGIYESLDLVKEQHMVQVLESQPNYSCTPLGQMFGIRYIFTQRDDIKDQNLRVLFTLKSFTVYENKLVLPRAILVAKAVVRPQESDMETVNFLFSKEFQPAEMVVLTGPALPSDMNDNKGALISSQPKIMSYDINEVLLQVQTEQPAWLVLFDTNYPGWQAEINGQETELYDADYLFRAIRVPAGDSLVRFSYRPVKFMIGAVIGTMILVVLSVLATRGIRTKCNGIGC